MTLRFCVVSGRELALGRRLGVFAAYMPSNKQAWAFSGWASAGGVEELGALRSRAAYVGGLERRRAGLSCW
jgi:hypothetical protein